MNKWGGYSLIFSQWVYISISRSLKSRKAPHAGDSKLDDCMLSNYDSICRKMTKVMQDPFKMANEVIFGFTFACRMHDLNAGLHSFKTSSRKVRVSPSKREKNIWHRPHYWKNVLLHIRNIQWPTHLHGAAQRFSVRITPRRFGCFVAARLPMVMAHY